MKQYLIKLKVGVILFLLSMSILTLAGCYRAPVSNGNGNGGGNFDIMAFLYKPYIAIPAALIIVYWMMKRGK